VLSTILHLLNIALVGCQLTVSNIRHYSVHSTRRLVACKEVGAEINDYHLPASMLSPLKVVACANTFLHAKLSDSWACTRAHLAQNSRLVTFFSIIEVVQNEHAEL
jgi:hypothetical protein